MVFFHLIDNLARGGAETLLLEVVRSLKGHKNYIITLTGETHFTKEETQDIEIVPLGYHSFFSFLPVIIKLKKLIAMHKPDLVHAHLPLSSAIARIATPRHVKLFVSVHNKYSESLAKKSSKVFFLEKKLHSKREVLIFVSESIKDDYDKVIGIKGRFEILYNFIADKFFKNGNNPQNSNVAGDLLKFVAVGSLKKQKNFDSLIKAFTLLQSSNCELSIYGNGPEKGVLQEMIKSNKLNNVYLKGVEPNIEKVFPLYDAFILPSVYEGFGLAPLEAAASGLPLLLSDIDVFKEVTKGHAIFFPPKDVNAIAVIIREFVNTRKLAAERAIAFKPILVQEYSRTEYIQKLINIYNS